MKKYFMWTFERGSRPYDIICAVILAFIFLTPPSAFDDRPDYMRLDGNQPVRQSVDDNGNPVFTVKTESSVFSTESVTRAAAEESLKGFIGQPFKVVRMLPVHDTTGALVAYSIWIERKP